MSVGRPSRSGEHSGVSGSDRRILYVLFTASGFAGLIYESIWTQYLKLFLGHAAYAQALVLAIFMGGLAIGSAIASRWSGRWRDLLAAYAVTEAAVGLLALVFHHVYGGATEFAYDVALPRLAGMSAAISAFKWALSAMLILPQCVLLGMTFPLMTGGVLRTFPDGPGRSIAMLYFTNSIGAAVGVLASGFALVRWVGLPGTVWTAGLLNLLVATEVWRRFVRPGRSAPAVAAGRSGPFAMDRIVAGYLLVSLATGASSFMYEIAWIRMLSLVLGSSTHAFEVMLSAFILGLALGGLWIQRRIDGLPAPVRYLAVVQVAMGLLALGTLPIYGGTFPVMQWLMRHLPASDGGYVLFNLASNGIALAIMLPATFCAGMTLPLITFRLMKLGHGEASIGAVYASNTVGAILAVFFAIHVGMPALGVKGLLTLGATIDLGLGVGLAWAARAAWPSRRAPIAVAAASAAAVGLTLGFVHLDPNRMASGVYRRGDLLDPEHERVVFHEDGKTATISLIENDGGYLRISTNGKVDAAVSMVPGTPAQLDESTMILAGIIPLALHPEARTAAVIGLGSGITTQTLLGNPRLTSVDTIEIEEQVVRAAQRFRPRNELAYADPRSHIAVDDAKTFFSTQAKTYDLIVSEPSNPWVSGVAGLFSDEFYRHARRHLTPGGVFLQWIQLYEIDVELVMSVLKALDANFSDWSVYAANDVDAIVVARNGGELPGPDSALLATPQLRPALQRVGVASVQDIALRKIGSRRAWRGLADSFTVRANSDFHPVLDQDAARTRFSRVNAQELLVFARAPLPALEMMSAETPRWGWTSVVRGPYFDGSRRAFQAALLRDMVLRPERPELVTALPPELKEQAAPVVSWLGACGGSATGPFPLQSLLSLAEHTVADLTPAELERMWAPVAAGPCASLMSEHDRRWFEFVAASSARDGARMAAAARVLLDTSPALDPATVRYLVAAAMLGHAALGDADGAATFWSRYGRGIDSSRYLLLRMLASRAARR